MPPVAVDAWDSYYSYQYRHSYYSNSTGTGSMVENGWYTSRQNCSSAHTRTTGIHPNVGGRYQPRFDPTPFRCGYTAQKHRLSMSSTVCMSVSLPLMNGTIPTPLVVSSFMIRDHTLRKLPSYVYSLVVRIYVRSRRMPSSWTPIVPC